MTPPPPYHRVPHLAPSWGASSDDAVLSPAERRALLEATVVVEEKLDGMNVMAWVDDGRPQVGTRGGHETSDRSGERGRLRRWASMHADALVDHIGDNYVLYGEWLRRRHAVPYERLPAVFVAFDVLDRTAERFLVPDERNALLRRMSVPPPPERFRGRLAGSEQLDRLLGISAFAPGRAEGLIVRRLDGREPRIAKHIDPVWRHIGSAEWSGENELVGPH